MKIRYWKNRELQIEVGRRRILIFANCRNEQGIWCCEKCMVDLELKSN